MLEENTGYILTRQAVDKNGKLELSYWVKTQEDTVQVLPDKQHCVLFADLDAAPMLLNKNGITVKEHGYRSFSDEPVVSVLSASLKHHRDTIQYLKAANIGLYEEDIRPADRYLMERNIHGAVRFVGQFDAAKKQYRHARLKAVEFSPVWRVWSLDIETSVTNNTLLSIGIVADTLRIAFVVTDSPNDDNRCVYFADEKSLLLAFMRFVKLHNPNIIIGWNLIAFDLAFIDRRCQALGLKPQFGVQGELWSFRGAETEGKQFIHIPGRVALDGIALLKVGGYHFESYSLNHVSQAILNDQKLLHDGGWQEIERMHAHELKRFVDYNLQDCDLVLRIFEQLHLVALQQTRVDLTGIPLEQMGGSVAAFENLYLPRLHKKGIVAPAWRDEAFISSPGGFVMSSKPGLYRNVLVFDFKSLYPSIIRTFYVDPLARVAAGEDRVDGFLGASFDKQTAILPELIKELASAREGAKATNNMILSYAIKIIMNSFYGVLGSNVCRFYHAELASSITMRGHQVLNLTRQWMESKGADIIYGDTDSLFVVLPDEMNDLVTEKGSEKGVGENSIEDREEGIKRQGQQLCDYINTAWVEWCQQQTGVTSHLELEFETLYQHFFMPTIRGQEEGSKKRYAGLADGKLVFKGLEAARSDWTPLARRFQRELFEIIFAEQNPLSYIVAIIDALKAGELNQELIYTKKLSRPLDAYVKHIPPHVRAARMHDARLIEEKLKAEYTLGGKRIQYVYLLTGVSPYLGNEGLLNLDYEHYIEKQLQPIADSILPFFATSMDQLLSKQISFL